MLLLMMQYPTMDGRIPYFVLRLVLGDIALIMSQDACENWGSLEKTVKRQ